MKRFQRLNSYNFRKAPFSLFKVKLDNIAIVPASLLPFKDSWQKVANNMPQGSILLYQFPENKPHQKILESVRSSFERKGHKVKILSFNTFAPIAP
ncbi:MAG: hypothetical protein M1365_16850 [Actinobacteria bacterium]|nr:hypothetical protein [Actinomycetota bacterium]